MPGGEGREGQGEGLLNENHSEKMLTEERSQRTGLCLHAVSSVGGNGKIGEK